MASISPTEARARMVDLIAESVFQALGLKEALEKERRALEAQDMDALNAVVDSKATYVERLQKLDQERDDLCEQWGFAKAPHQMTALIEWCDEDALISAAWEQLLRVAAEGSALNITNGAIIRVRQQHFESSLSILRGDTPGSDTYGRHGEDTGEFSRRSLAEA